EPGGSYGSSRQWTLAELRRWQREAHNDLATFIGLAGRHEPEPLVEPSRPIVPRYETGQQFRGALSPHQPRDLPDDRRAVAAALVPLVDQQLPQEPRPNDLRRLRLAVPADHHE